MRHFPTSYHMKPHVRPSKHLWREFRRTAGIDVPAAHLHRLKEVHEGPFYDLLMTFAMEVVQLFGTAEEQMTMHVFLMILRRRWRGDDACDVTVTISSIRGDTHQDPSEVRSVMHRLCELGVVEPKRGAGRYGLVRRLDLLFIARCEAVTEVLERRVSCVEVAGLQYTYLCPAHGCKVNDEVSSDSETEGNPFPHAVPWAVYISQKMACTRQGCGKELMAVEPGQKRYVNGYTSSEDDAFAPLPSMLPEHYTRVGALVVDPEELDGEGGEERQEQDCKEDVPGANCPASASWEMIYRAASDKREVQATSTTAYGRLENARCRKVDSIANAGLLLREHVQAVFLPLHREMESYTPLAQTIQLRERPPTVWTHTAGGQGVCQPVLLRESMRPRPYQLQAVSAIVPEGGAVAPRSGVLVMPCGSGKTVVGIITMHRVTVCESVRAPSPGPPPSDRVMIVCNSNHPCVQWQNQLRRYTALGRADVCIFNASSTLSQLKGARVIITTYQRMSVYLSKSNLVLRDQVARQPYALQILDEVHMVTGRHFRRCVTLPGHVAVRVGLTATLKNDVHITQVRELVGPVLYQQSVDSLVADGYLSRVHCNFVRVPRLMPPAWEQGVDCRFIGQMEGMDPGVLAGAMRLLHLHIKSEPNCKVMIISEYLTPLRIIRDQCRAANISYYYVDGSTQNRTRIYNRFQTHQSVRVLIASKVTEMALDLPQLSVLIQLSFLHGADWAAEQRAGRVARIKRGAVDNVGHYYVLYRDEVRSERYARRAHDYLASKGFQPTYRQMAVSEEDARRELTRNYWVKAQGAVQRMLRRNRKPGRRSRKRKA